MNFDTLRAQIGIGNLMAVGARDFFTDGPNSFGFKVGSRRGWREAITITLDKATDTYKVRYVRMRNRDLDIRTEEIPDVHADQLGRLVRELGDH
jgi:hypothetical protein